MLRTNNQEEKSLLKETEIIPECMRKERRWLVWAYQDRQGKKTKEPFCAWHNDGRVPHASSTDPATWSSFEEALAFWKNNQGRFEGLGFVLGDGWAGVDLDDCIDPLTGEIEDWAHCDIDELNSYTEISPSGRGLKIFLRSDFFGDGLG